MSFIKRGYDVPDEARGGGGAGDRFLRFWLKRNTKTYGILLDDIPACFFEHNPKIHGTFDNWFTCVKNLDGYEYCPGCVGKDRRYWIGMLTMLDLTPYKKKDGTEVKWKKRILAMKGITIELMERKKERHNGLVLAKFEIFRGKGQQAPAVGDQWEHEGTLSIDQVKKLCPGITEDDLRPFDYETMFAPKPIGEIKAILEGAASQEEVSTEGGEAPKQENDIPF